MDRRVLKHIADPLYDHHIIYDEDLAAIKKRKRTLFLNKPIYAGMAVLRHTKNSSEEDYARGLPSVPAKR